MLSLYRINTKTGKVYSKKRKKEVCFSKDSKGYHILILRRNGIVHAVLRSHMVFWAKNKYMPDASRCIDHKNEIRTDDRASNLDDITQAENSAKRKKKKNNFYGVCLSKNTNKYRASLTKNKKRKNLGEFDSDQEAAMMRDQAIVQAYWTEYNDRGFLPPLNFPEFLPNYIQNVKNPKPRMVQLELKF